MSPTETAQTSCVPSCTRTFAPIGAVIVVPPWARPTVTRLAFGGALADPPAAADGVTEADVAVEPGAEVSDGLAEAEAALAPAPEAETAAPLADGAVPGDSPAPDWVQPARQAASRTADARRPVKRM